VLSTPKSAGISVYTDRMIHYVNCMKMGLRLDYDDFSMQELRDMEYIYLKLENKKTELSFKTLFDGLVKIVSKVMKSFKR